MKKCYSFFVLFLALWHWASGKPIDEATARRAGLAFLQRQNGAPVLRGPSALALAYRMGREGTGGISSPEEAYFYVFNRVGGPGFVLVAGDDAVGPVLGYSQEVGFDPATLPPSVAKWLEGYKNEIRYAVAHSLATPPAVRAGWQSLIAGSAGTTAARSSAAVAPLLQTKWDQNSNFNALCPVMASGQQALTGCVATAMAQVMKYWQYPATGQGFHSYQTDKYGTLSANYGTTTYDWNAMPNNVTGPNSAVATLMYQAGVGVNMSYGTTSLAWVISADCPIQNNAEYALKTYFGYQPSLQGLRRDSYSPGQWMGLLKAELDAQRPIIYTGAGDGGGHCFVADGYDANDFLHFNWGWGGRYDGYFSLNAMNPNGVGTGGGSGRYNNWQTAILGIAPPAAAGPTTFSLGLYNSSVALSTTSLGYRQGFSVTASVINRGGAAFGGDYAAALFDNANNFVGFVETKTGATLPAGYYANLTFSTTGLASLLPGSYRVGVFYRPTGGNYVLVPNQGTFTNLVALTVTNENTLQLNSTLAVAPTVLTKGENCRVTFNLLNRGTSTFKGQYGVNLYKLDGTFQQALGSYDETAGLSAGYTYQAPYLSFEAAITADPGTYLLAVVHLPAGSADLQLTGSTAAFQNPVQVNVKASSLLADPYEVNNTVAQATPLPVAFSGNAATLETPGSNCHVPTDVDYYKLALPPGYNYSVNARLHDVYNSGNGNSYTLDALFSYSTDGGATWSSAYDDVMPAPIILNGGGTLYVKVVSFFEGGTGTYLFSTNVTQSVALAVALAPPATTGRVVVFPNPAKNTLSVDLQGVVGTVRKMQLLTVQGQAVYQVSGSVPHALLQVPVATLTDGLYVLCVETSQGVLTQKVMIGP